MSLLAFRDILDSRYAEIFLALSAFCVDDDNDEDDAPSLSSFHNRIKSNQIKPKSTYKYKDIYTSTSPPPPPFLINPSLKPYPRTYRSSPLARLALAYSSDEEGKFQFG